ncbi:MAG TPA: putative LPS assembly protein LptD [Thermoanaerobaculaceae bacterium]|nr:putative LPS assembly protein LptD [Thermoanaerobaculaceae bacterium]HRS16357.1 putative LPS assembly protein LptD [Thermoanaerobaculaceae bacterium]
MWRAPAPTGWKPRVFHSAGALLASFLALGTLAGEPAGPAQAISLQAQHQQWVEDQLLCAQGNVRVAYQDIRVQCDEIEVDLSTMTLRASGRVVVDQADSRMACDRLEFDLRRKVGTFYAVDAFLPPTYYFRGAELEKLDETHYRIKDGLFTSCQLTDDAPPWSIDVAEATLELEGYGHFRGVSMRVQGVPVFYTPRLLWPIKRDRAAGFLVPNFGYNNRRGSYFGTAFFWPVSRAFDTTFYLDLYSKSYVGAGNELRWAPAENARGSLQLYTLRDPATDTWEWKALGKHSQLFAGGYSIKGQLDETSNFDFFRRFERSADRNTRPDLFSFLTLSRTWGAQSVNLRTDHRRRVYETRTGQTVSPPDLVLDRLGEVEYRLRSTRLGRTPLYVSLVALADTLRVERSETLHDRYGRIDVFPTVSLLTSGLPWLSITPTIGGRETYYTKRYELDAYNRPTRFADEALSRSYWTGGLSLVGPSVSRIWSLGSGNKLKHLVEPRVEYSYISNPGDQRIIPVFDEKDSVLVANRLRWTLANRLFHKQGESGSREVASFELYQDYSFTDPLTYARPPLEASRRGPLTAALRAMPLQGMSVDIRASGGPFTGSTRSTSFTSSLARGASNLALTWNSTYDPLKGSMTSSQAILSGALAPVGGRWRLESRLVYDFHNRLALDQRYAFQWRGSCWSAFAEYRDYRAPGLNSRDYRISIDLTGLGTFLDIHGGLDSGN